MDLKSGSSSNSRNIGYYGGRKLCACRLPAKIFTAWTDKNPGRKFFGCELYKVKIEKMILGCFSSNGMGYNIFCCVIRKEGMTLVLTLSGLIKKKFMVGQRGL